MQPIKRFTKPALLTILLLLIMASTSVGFAQDGSLGDDATTLGEPFFVDEAVQHVNADGTVTLLVELYADPTTVVYSETLAGGESVESAEAAGDAAEANVVQEQLNMRPVLQGLGATELYSIQHVLNAMVINVDPSQMAAISALPGVKSVGFAPIHELDNSTSVPFIGANTVWDSTGALSTLDLTGNGITIAIIDTGVDYLHRNFGGSANYAAQTNVASMADTGGFPQGGVISGTDFVGDAYTGANTPVPDPDPTDCNGHGSHVAGSAAGRGVDAGVTWAGGYDNLTPGVLAGFEIGPGVAPEASIMALKVFGCTGSTSVVLQAIDYAVNNGADVINMSLGSNYGFAGYDTAIGNAVNAGVIVVTSAGNASDVHYITGTPGSTTTAISTAASNDGGNFSASVDVTSPVPASYYAIPAGFGPALTTLTPAVPAPLEYINDGVAGGTVNDGCEAFTMTAGGVAIMDRGFCNFTVKVKNAQNAGASAAIVVNVSSNVPTVMGGADPTITIPSVMISNDAGNVLKPSLPSNGQLNPAGVSQGDILADFSSKGPRRANLGGGEVMLKPDITAPGSGITSTRTCYNGTCTGVEPAGNSGTSMASPHIAGVMALLRELYPFYSVQQLKALVMNTATHDVFSPNLITGNPGTRFGTERIGAGRVDVVNATTEEVIAYNSSNPYQVGVPFTTDVLNGGPSSENQTITVENNTFTSVTYNLSIDTAVDITGVAFSVSPSSVTVPPLSTANFTVTVNYTPASMTHSMFAASLTQQNGFFRHWISEESGYVVMDAQSGATVDLRVPLYAAPRPASAMDSPALINTGAATGTVSVPLTGVDVNNGAGTTRYRSQVSGFQLLHSSPENAAGYQAWDGGDLRYVGVSSDIPVGGSRSYFGLSMWGNWDTPRMREVFVCLDLNQDGAGGAMGDGTDWCWRARTDSTGNVFSDAHMVYLYDINNFLGAGAGAQFSVSEYQNIRPDVVDTRLMDSSLLMIASGTTPAYWNSLIGAATVKYTGGNTTDPGQAFNFRVYTQDLNDPSLITLGVPFGPVTDSSPMLTFDPTLAIFTPVEGFFGVAGRMSPVIDDLNATAFDWSYNLSGPTTSPLRSDLLFLHHYNASGSRADVITVNAPPSVPVLLAPADTATGVSTSAPLDWTDSDFVPSGYQVQVDNNADFSSPEVDANPAVSNFTTPGLASGTYFWRVRAFDSDGAFSAWSTVWTFTTVQNVTLSNPTGSASCLPRSAWVSVRVHNLTNGTNYTFTQETYHTGSMTYYHTRQFNILYGGTTGATVNFKAVIFKINDVPALVPGGWTTNTTWASLPVPVTTRITFVNRTTNVQSQYTYNYHCGSGAVVQSSSSIGPITNPLYAP